MNNTYQNDTLLKLTHGNTNIWIDVTQVTYFRSFSGREGMTKIHFCGGRYEDGVIVSESPETVRDMIRTKRELLKP